MQAIASIASTGPALRYDPQGNAVRSAAELTHWHAGGGEAPLEPDLPVIDAHHHLRRRPGQHYLPTHLMADCAGQHVLATICIEYGSGHSEDGPAELRPVGETAFVVGEIPSHRPELCAGIVGRADLRLGASVRPVLEAHIAAGAGRFRGIRHPLRWDADGIGMFGRPSPRALALDPAFRAGFAELAPLGLSFDAWAFHHQLGEIADLARAFPDTTIIVNHAGGPLGVGRYAGHRAEMLALWRHGLVALAACANVLMKIGGLGMLYYGFDFHARPAPPGSLALAAAWRPLVETCFALFGPERCMFESNFPVDKQSCGYAALLNAYKRLTKGFSAAERHAFFVGTAARAYRLSHLPQVMS